MKLNNLKENIIIHLENLEKINNNSIDGLTVEDIEISISSYGTYKKTFEDVLVYDYEIISLLQKNNIKIKMEKINERFRNRKI